MAHLEENNINPELVKRLNALLPRLIEMKEEINSSIQLLRSTLSFLYPTMKDLYIGIIKDEVLSFFNVSTLQLQSKSSIGDVKKARHIFCTLCYRKTDSTFAEIGLMVNRDHSTVLNSGKVIDSMQATNDPLFHQYEAIETNVDILINKIKLNENRSKKT